VRETAFNWINHLRDANWSQANVLDLFAGSGALGFEAASRGAASVLMADTNTAVIRQLDTIKTKLHAANVTLQRADALVLAQSLAARRTGWRAGKSCALTRRAWCTTIYFSTTAEPPDRNGAAAALRKRLIFRHNARSIVWSNVGSRNGCSRLSGNVRSAHARS
jgi:16S rRNA G966 N2-methylase RsmD